MKLAFIGLGVMGYPMAGHLSKAGHEVCVYNRTASKAAHWCGQYEGKAAASPFVVAQGADIVFSCVGRDEDVEAIALGEQGAFAGMSQGSIFVDHTTTSAKLAKRLDDEARRRGLEFLDAPVSGGQAGAEQGSLSVMVGGAKNSFATAMPVIECYAKMVKWMGGAGSGQLSKMVNQICLAGLIQSLSEGLFFAEQVGLDTKQLIEVISKGAAQSWQMDNRASTMLERSFEFGFAVDWMRKDLGIVQQQAKEKGLKLPVVEMVDQFYRDIQERGGARWDTSSLIKRMDEKGFSD